MIFSSLVMSLVAKAPYPPFGEARTSKFSVLKLTSTVGVADGEEEEDVEEVGDEGEGEEVDGVEGEDWW